MNFQSKPNMHSYFSQNASRSKLYELTELQKLSLGNTEFVHKMVTIFLQQAPLLLKQIRIALEAGDLDKISIYSYKIKTSIQTLGIHSLLGVVRKLERVRDFQSDKAEINKLVLSLEEGLELVISELNRDFRK